jgi:hypothetical protein
MVEEVRDNWLIGFITICSSIWNGRSFTNTHRDVWFGVFVSWFRQ